MERNGLLHHAALWLAVAIVVCILVLAGYWAFARLMRVPEIPQSSHAIPPLHMSSGIVTGSLVVSDRQARGPHREPLGTGTVIWTQREVCDESGCRWVPIEGAAGKVRVLVEPLLPPLSVSCADKIITKGDTITIVADGVLTVLTEGIAFDCESQESNDACRQSIAAALAIVSPIDSISFEDSGADGIGLEVRRMNDPTDIILRGGEGSDIYLDDFDTGVYQGDGDQVLVIDGREALRWKAGPEVRRKGDGWEICNPAETVCEDFPAFP